MGRLNLLYLHSHDTGRRIGPYGHAVPTPHLQAFADQSTRFTNAHCAGPTCSPSRAGLLTGQWAHCSGMVGLAHRGFALNDPGQHVAHLLRSQGYETVIAGIQHVARYDRVESLGYGKVIPHKNDTIATSAESYLRSSPKEPFFLDAGFIQTHRPFPDPACDAAETTPATAAVPAYLPDEPRTRQDAAAYNTMARALDDHYGRILKALDESGLADKTIVLITTDHGEAFPGAKCNLTSRGTGVLMMLRGPGIPARRVIDSLVSHIDVLPTLCQRMNLPRPPWYQGTSLVPLLDGSADQVRQELFSEVTYHAAYEPMRMIRTPRYCLIRRFGDRGLPVLANCDDGLSKDAMLDAGWGDQCPDREQLYDVLLDPAERKNLATDPAHAAALADLRTRLDVWMRDTADPLLQGDVPPPPGSQVNAPDDPSPNRKPREY